MQRTLAHSLTSAFRTTTAHCRTAHSAASFSAALSSNSSSTPSSIASSFSAALQGSPAAAQSPLASTSSTLPPSIHHATSSSPSSSPSSSSSSRPRDPAAVDPDAELLGVLARLIMRDGKLARTHAHLDAMLAHLQLSTSSPPLPILRKALDLTSPSIRIVGRRSGTKVNQTPQPLTAAQRRRQAWKWIVEASDKRQGVEKAFGKRLALEVLAVLNGQSEALKKLEARHTQGVTGRANVGR
ncbi:hypothetical protein JCM6882_009227 [Rhodosporidiobolus microsporus]